MSHRTSIISEFYSAAFVFVLLGGIIKFYTEQSMSGFQHVSQIHISLYEKPLPLAICLVGLKGTSRLSSVRQVWHFIKSPAL